MNICKTFETLYVWNFLIYVCYQNFRCELLNKDLAISCACNFFYQNVPLQFPSPVLKNPVSHVHTKDPFLFSHKELFGQTDSFSHSFTSSLHCIPVQPFLHVHIPVTWLHSSDLYWSQRQSALQFFPYIQELHSKKTKRRKAFHISTFIIAFCST